MNKEYLIQVAICDYLKHKYPDVEFRSDLGGIRLTIGPARKIQRIQKQRAWPDLWISEARMGYHGLYLEIKKDRDELYTKEGKIRVNQHIIEQWHMLKRLRERGYMACFVCGLDHAIDTIDWYLKGET